MKRRKTGTGFALSLNGSNRRKVLGVPMHRDDAALESDWVSEPKEATKAVFPESFQISR